MRILPLVLAFVLIGSASSASAGDFRLYPGFIDRDAIVEMTNDRGLMVEIVLRCSRRANGQVRAGIMTYSKVERLYCSSKNRCTPDASRAFEDTCS